MSLIAILAATSLFSFDQDDRKERETPTQPPPHRLLMLKYAGGADVARKLKALFGDNARVVFDTASNTVFIQTTLARLRLGVAYARELDENERCWDGVVRRIPLRNIKATDAATGVKALWRVLTFFREDCKVVLVADKDNTTLVISGTIRHEEEVKSLVQLLDTKPK